MNKKQQEREEAKQRLLELLKPGDVVYTVLRHRSASGMSRVVDLVVIKERTTGDKAGAHAIFHLGWNAADALGWGYNRNWEGVKVGGCGMDMGFHIVYELSHTLFGDGYTLKQEWL